MSIATTPLPLLAFKSDEVSRGFGVLEVQQNGDRAQLPLAGVDIRARVVDRFAESTLTETFRNPYREHLEATYIFPLPGGAAVSDFELHVAGRIVRGAVEERGEARRQYAQAKQEGKRAALLEKERDDVFTVAVGNLPPGEEVKVVIRWSERLPWFDDGTTELRLPLVVAPRYIPGQALDRDGVGKGTEPDTDLVPDASRITPPRLADGFDPKTALSIEVELHDGALDDLGCSQHATRMKLGQGGVTVKLAREGERLNRDFILRWRLAADRIQTHVWQSGGHAALSLVPPKREGFLGTPRDVVFVLDRSGSMSGDKMVSASRACAILLATLGPRDRFAIQLFDDTVEWYDPRSGQIGMAVGAHTFIAADEAGIEKGERFLRTVEARGGTELDLALRQALDALGQRREALGRSPAVVLLTDGQIGDEGRVLKRLQTELGDSRVFTVGIDTAVNETFLRRVATAAGGTATFVTPGESLEEALQGVGREIGTPLVVDVKVHGVADLAPATIPDLFAGRATVAYFRPGEAKTIRVSGRYADGQSFDQTVTPTVVEMPAIAQLWAKTRITDLEDRYRVEHGRQDELKAEIVAISKAHRVLTRFTAFVVIDDEVVNKDGRMRSVTQPVEMPAQWEMEQQKSVPMPMSAPAAAPPCPPPPVMQARLSAPPAMGDLLDIDDEAADAFGTLAPPWSAPGGPPARSAAPPLGGAPSPKTSRARQAAPKKAKGGGLFGGLFRKQEKADVLREEGGGGDAGAADIHAALAALLDALQKALDDLRKGTRPSAETLDRARQALLKALAASHRGPDLVLAQRFVRTAALEMVAALQSDTDTASLTPLFERHAKALEEARDEAVKVLGKPQAGFWEASI